ncbi:hypothetical protein ACFWHG_31720 [Streptomyces microflavus]
MSWWTLGGVTRTSPSTVPGDPDRQAGEGWGHAGHVLVLRARPGGEEAFAGNRTKGTPDLADVRVPLRGGPHPSFGIPSGASTAA